MKYKKTSIIFVGLLLIFILNPFFINHTIGQINDSLINQLFSSEHDPETKLISKNTIEFKIKQQQPPTSYPKGQAMAGIAMRDITPPPGLSTAGHSSFAPIAKGVRTRLKCRVIYIKGINGVATMIIQVDLAGPSRILHHSVASAISHLTDVPYGNIALSATHTHSSNGNFSDALLFNKHFSSQPGLNLQQFDLIKDQIVSAALEAYNSRKPAKIASGYRDIYYVNRNRAIKSYIRNKGNEHLDPEKDSLLIFKAVNPKVYMTRIDVLENNVYVPIGAYSNFSVHGTAIARQTEVYSADLFGFTQRDISNRIKEECNLSKNPIFAFSTGTEGDMTPNLPFYNGGQYEKELKNIHLDWKAAKKLGFEVSNTAWELFKSLEADLSDSIVVKGANRELDIIENNTIDDYEICKRPSIGLAGLNGAYENRAVKFFLFNDASFFVRKIFYSENRCLGIKAKPLGVVSRLMQPAKDYPRNAMFQYIQIGDIGYFFSPWELTITSGSRISDKIKTTFENSKISPPHLISIVGAANDYLGYATTPEEYKNQNYEGGMSYYGKNTVPFITSHVGRLINDFISSGKDTYYDLPKDYNIQTLVKDLYPKKIMNEDYNGRKLLDEPKYILEDLKNVIDEPYIAFRWEDLSVPEMKFHESILAVEKSSDKINWEPLVLGNHTIDDEGYDVEIQSIKQKKEFINHYEGRWYNPEMDSNTHYRFRILARNNSQIDLFVPIKNGLIP